MVKLDLNEVAYIHKVISEQTIKGAEAPFVAGILNKMANEAGKLQKEINPPKK